MGTHLKAGLKWAMEISRLGNQYLQDAEPWTVLKSDPEQCGTICYVAVNLVYLISNVFEPFMPGFSDKVCYQLNFDHGKIPDVFEEVIPAGHKINKILEAIFGIKTGFYGSLVSNAARIDFKGIVEDVNDKHLKPWSEMCQAAGIASTPLTPYLDPELLYNNAFSIDGSAIEATGFKYQYPNVTEALVREQMQYYVEQKLFPVEK